MFQAIPLISDLEDQVVGISIGITICPFVSLMLDQVAYLKSIRLNAAAVYNGQDEEILRDVEEGLYSHIYATPESMLSVKRWQKMLQSPHFVENCIVVAVVLANGKLLICKIYDLLYLVYYEFIILYDCITLSV